MNARCPREPKQGGLGYEVKGKHMRASYASFKRGQSRGIKGLSRVKVKSELKERVVFQRGVYVKPKL